jgi:hypothetical protein
MLAVSALLEVALEPSDAFPCGWRAEVVGDFTLGERNALKDVVRELRYSLGADRLGPPAIHSVPAAKSVRLGF